MIRFNFLVFLLVICTGLFAQDPDCSKIKTGTFKSTLITPNGPSKTMLYREKDKQIEENVEQGIKMEFVVKWTSDCSYELSRPKILKGEVPGVADDQIIYVKVIAVNNERYSAEVSSNFSDSKHVFDYLIIKKE